MSDTTLAAARAFAAAGCCVIPTRSDGTKAPALDWKHYQQQHPTAEDLTRWFSTHDGLGVVCGAVSGGLEMLELEGRAAHLFTQLGQALDDHGAGELWRRLCTGYLEQSPSGGFHWLYRVVDAAEPRGNTKLARRPSTDDELAEWVAREYDATAAITDPARHAARMDRISATRPDQVPQVMIETRGEGGYVVVAPSHGTTHPSGRPWVLLAGAPASIPTVTELERDLLHAVCSMFDTMPAHQPAVPVPAPSGPDSGATVTPRADGELRPGDDYEQRTSWAEILEPHGWTQALTFPDGGLAWTRPGKHPRDGFSATTGRNADADRLYVFSSSTEFETETPYRKFGAYALLKHGGDHAAAAAELRRRGYGSPLEEARPLTFTGAPPAATSPPGPATTTPAVQPPSEPTRVDAYSLTDDGNALRLVDRHQQEIRYVPQRGLWLSWDGHRWIWDEAEHVRELARGIARDLPEHNDAQRKHRAKALNAPSIAAQVRLAQTDPRVVVHMAKLDAHPYQLNTPGGVVDLRTGTITPPDPADLHTRSTNVAPDFTVDAPRWARFLADTFAGDPELTTYVQRLIGVSLIGQVLEQILPFAHGSGANGKTTMLGAIQRIVGFGDTGYSISAPAELLLATRNQDHPASIAQLQGARLVVTSELEDGQNFAEARVKQLTGRDAINARFMRQNPFTFTPSHTMFVLANHQPQVRAGGPAFWRRIAMLPFLHTVPVDQRDPGLEDYLVDVEGPAVLAWCVRGAADYLQHGLTVPESVRNATEAYERDQDTVARFVAELCEIGEPHDSTLQSRVLDVRSAYEAWCHVEGEQPVTPKAFTQTLRTAHNVWSQRSSSTRYYLGIRLLEAPAVAPWQPPAQAALTFDGPTSP